jgi:hypothetical protein
VQAEIDSIGERVGERMWDLDEKLVALIDADTAGRTTAG